MLKKAVNTQFMTNYSITDLLLAVRQITKQYKTMTKQIGKYYGLSQIEMTILGFLHNNPGKDTARDIVELRMLPKGQVSQGISSLLQKGLLTRQQDQADRRLIHLSLTSDTMPIVQGIEESKHKLSKVLYNGFSPEEQAQYLGFVNRIVENINHTI